MIRRLFLILTLTPFIALAASQAEPTSYRFMSETVAPAVSVPTVIEVPVPPATETPDALVVDDTGTPVPRYMKISGQPPGFLARESASPSSAETPAESRSFSFPVDGQSPSQSTIIVTSLTPRAVSGFSVTLDENVALPNKVEVRAGSGPSETVVLAPSTMSGQTVRFPQTTASEWRITFTHTQPLRISGIRMSSPTNNISYSARFLAQPGRTYVVYSDPDVVRPQLTGESGNLASDRDVRRRTPKFLVNPSFKPVDSDMDGVADRADNCVSLSNPDQTDQDQNSQGDACDDWDRDSRINSSDNCREAPNAAQTDTDSDGMGDACDSEESRFTEANAWVPWLAIGFAAFVILALTAVMLGRSHAHDMPPSA